MKYLIENTFLICNRTLWVGEHASGLLQVVKTSNVWNVAEWDMEMTLGAEKTQSITGSDDKLLETKSRSVIREEIE